MGRVMGLSILCGMAGMAIFFTLFQWGEREWVLQRLGVPTQFQTFMDWWLRKRHQAQKVRDFPDFLDLLVLALASGHAFPHAFHKAVHAMPVSALKKDLEKTVEEWNRGRPISDALMRLSKRLTDPRIHRLPHLIIQCLKTGSSLEGLLADLSASLRSEYFHSIERQAQTASLRLLFPIFVFLLPAVFLILLGPLIIQISQRGSLF